MKIEVKSDNKVQVKTGSILALKRFDNWIDEKEYYLVINSDSRYYLANIENGQMSTGGFSNTEEIDELVRMKKGTVYSGSEAKLILKGDA